MGGFISKIFRNYWVLSVFCIVMGLALIIDPEFFSQSISWVVGGLFSAYGVVYLVKYFLSADEENFGFDLVRGIILIAIGVFLIVRREFIPNVIAIVTGFYMLVSSVVSLQSNLKVRRAGVDGWQLGVFLSLVTLLGGGVLLFNPLMGRKIVMTVLGIALFVTGISNTVSCFRATRKLNKLRRAAESRELAIYEGSRRNRRDNDDFIDV